MLGLIIGITGGTICALIAPHRRRNPYSWFAIGFITPLFGVIALLVMNPLPDPFFEFAVPVPGPDASQLAEIYSKRQVEQSHKIDVLHKLVELKGRGALTETEFEETRLQLLQRQ